MSIIINLYILKYNKQLLIDIIMFLPIVLSLVSGC